ncbi:MAG: tyrosine-type recombinase/integrase [Geminicoccaceae bacterium]|nr:tyrosine-type recombinase/integrase [Geminicoccaceae bacterium]
MPKLTKRTVEGAAPQAADVFLWDDELKGFGVRVWPSGRRVYLVQYRAGGRTRRVKLGAHGALTAEEARKRARELLGTIAGGDDPAEALHTHRRAPTVAALGARFLAEHVAHRCKPSTQGEYRRCIELFINPRIGTHKVPDIRRQHVQALHDELRRIPYQANRALGVLSKMFSLAEAWGLRPDGSNPCRHVRKYPEQKRERFLSAEELRRLGAALAGLEVEMPEMRAAVAAVRLLVLTGCRLGEIQTLCWAHVKGSVLELPDSKTGAKRVWLNRAALDVLAALERHEGNPYVIQGRQPKSHLTDLQKPWRRIRARAGLADVRLHDLRHSFASFALMNGEALPVIGRLLGHSQVQTTARYAHLADDPLQAAAERTGAHINAFFDSQAIGRAP